MNTFNKGDKVVKIGTELPIMVVLGNATKTGIPYRVKEDCYICEWINKLKEKERKEFREDEIHLVSNS